MKPNAESERADTIGRGPVNSPDKVPEWSKLQRQVMKVLEKGGVNVKLIDVTTVLLEAVPVGSNFNKTRSNILLRKLRTLADIFIFVDADLAYQGSDERIVKALSGFCRKDWRCITPYPLRGDISRVLRFVLDTIDSPLAEQVGLALQPTDVSSQRMKRVNSDGMLESLGELISSATAEQAYNQTFRSELVTQLAIAVSCPQSPNSILLWGQSGVGKDLLMLAIVHLLYSRGKIDQAFIVSCARIAVGSIFPAEVDNILTQVLTEALRKNCLLLLQGIDVCLTSSEVAKAVLCEAIDSGLRFLATMRSQKGAVQLAQDESFVRRILPVRVPQPSAKQVRRVLERISNDSAIRVQPAAIESILGLSRRYGEAICEPAWSIGILSAAISQAEWYGASQVDPDSVYSVLRPEWPKL